LGVEPNVVTFPFTPNKPVTSCIHITNTSDTAVEFKIRTTKPNLYTVLPSTGTLKSKLSQTVKITLMPTHELGDSSHKFMALAVSCDDTLDKAELWKQPTVSKVLIPASFLKESDAHFDIVRENIQSEVRQLSEKTWKVIEECEKLEAEIKKIDSDMLTVVQQMLDASEESTTIKAYTQWSCWHLMMAAYLGMTLGFFFL